MGVTVEQCGSLPSTAGCALKPTQRDKNNNLSDQPQAAHDTLLKNRSTSCPASSHEGSGYKMQNPIPSADTQRTSYGTFQSALTTATSSSTTQQLGQVVFDDFSSSEDATTPEMPDVTQAPIAAMDWLYACAVLPVNILQRIMIFMVVLSSIIPPVLNACNPKDPQTVQADLFVAFGGFILGTNSTLGLESLQSQIRAITQYWQATSSSCTKKAGILLGIALALLTAIKASISAVFKNLPLIPNKPTSIAVSTAIAIPEFFTGPLIELYAIDLGLKKTEVIKTTIHSLQTQGMSRHMAADILVETLALLLVLSPAYYSEAIDEWFDPTPFNQWLSLNCAADHSLRLALSSPEIIASILALQDTASTLVRWLGRQAIKYLCQSPGNIPLEDVEANQPLILYAPNASHLTDSNLTTNPTADTAFPTPAPPVTIKNFVTNFVIFGLAAAGFYGQYLATLQDTTLTQDASFSPNDTLAELCSNWAEADAAWNIPTQIVTNALFAILAISQTKSAFKQCLGAFLPHRRSSTHENTNTTP